jgi:hypothetical protein
MVVIMNIMLNMLSFMLYISGCLIQDHMLNRNIENHPGKPYYHKAYGSALLSNYRTLVLGWWLVLVEVGPEGGRRHNSPLIVSLPSRLSQSYFHYSRRGKETRKYLTKQEMKQGNTQQTEDRRFGNCLRCSLFITVCSFHYKGFTIYRSPLGMVICLNYTFSVPDKQL